jgi:signal transduction histidine kinase
MLPSPEVPDALPERARRVVARIGPGVVDLGLAGATGLLVLLDLNSAGGSRSVLWSLLIGGCAVVAVIARRWLLLPAFVVLVALVVADGLALRGGLPGLLPEVSFPRIAPLAGLSAVVTPVIRRSTAPVAAAAAVVGFAAVGFAVWSPGGTTDRAVLLLLFLTMYVVGAGAGVYLRDLDRQRRDAAARARDDVRLDLARDLHDLVAHHVTAIVVQAQAGQVVVEGDPARAAEVFRTIETAGRDSLTAMRDLVGSLRSVGAADDGAPGGAAPTAPVAGLADLDTLARAGARTGPPVAVTISDAARARVPDATGASIHRITREALTNARRHATDATRIDVAVDVDGTWAVLRVTDDGRASIGPTPTGGYGLVGMRERAELLGGTLVAGPVPPPGRGWRVEARLPLDPVARP